VGRAPLSDGQILALAYPERVAEGSGAVRVNSSSPRDGAPSSRLATSWHGSPGWRWLNWGAGDRRDRILLAAPLTEPEILATFANILEMEDRIEESPGGRVRVRRLTRLGRLSLHESLDDNPPAELVAQALAARLRRDGLGALRWGPAASALRQRVGFLRRYDPETWPDLSDEALAARLDDWLTPLLHGLRGISDLTPDLLDGALQTLAPWDIQRRLEAELPTHWTAPTGSRVPIDYEAEGGPRVDIRVQEVFGLNVHPQVAGRPLTLALLSPARRPIQMTQDLPGFWKGSWKDVRAEMRGRYPKHPWPEDPSVADPTTRAKPRS